MQAPNRPETFWQT